MHSSHFISYKHWCKLWYKESQGLIFFARIKAKIQEVMPQEKDSL